MQSTHMYSFALWRTLGNTLSGEANSLAMPSHFNLSIRDGSVTTLFPLNLRLWARTESKTAIN